MAFEKHLQAVREALATSLRELPFLMPSGRAAGRGAQLRRGCAAIATSCPMPPSAPRPSEESCGGGAAQRLRRLARGRHAGWALGLTAAELRSKVVPEAVQQDGKALRSARRRLAAIARQARGRQTSRAREGPSIGEGAQSQSFRGFISETR